MEPLVIHTEIVIDAPLDRVWFFVGTPDGMRQWFGADELMLEPQIGGRYEWRTATLHMRGVVVAYDPPRRISMTQRERMADGAFWPEDTVISISLREEAGRTHVRVEQSGFERLPAEYRERIFAAYGGGWQTAIDRLRELAGSPGSADLRRS